MKLSIWLYHHRHGVDLLTVRHDRNTGRIPEVDEEEIVNATGIQWEPERDEMLEHVRDLDLADLSTIPVIE
jgi:hypothetical protein